MGAGGGGGLQIQSWEGPRALVPFTHLTYSEGNWGLCTTQGLAQAPMEFKSTGNLLILFFSFPKLLLQTLSSSFDCEENSKHLPVLNPHQEHLVQVTLTWAHTETWKCWQEHRSPVLLPPVNWVTASCRGRRESSTLHLANGILMEPGSDRERSYKKTRASPLKLAAQAPGPSVKRRPNSKNQSWNPHWGQKETVAEPQRTGGAKTRRRS